jgi:predicted regulator of Ras-like GTPase activity (Roadblock/LC7/MglB family)
MNGNLVGQPLLGRTTSTDSHLDWLVDELVVRAAYVEKAAVLSSDGLVLAASAALSREGAEHLSALAAGLASLANGGARHFGIGQVRQIVIEMDEGFLFVTAAGAGSCLAVIAGTQADVSLIAYEMALLVKQVGRHLAAASRPAPGAAEAR